MPLHAAGQINVTPRNGDCPMFYGVARDLLGLLMMLATAKWTIAILVVDLYRIIYHIT